MKNRAKKISTTVSQSRWLAYTAAGLATAAAGATAEAEIHYTGHLHLRLNGQKFSSDHRVSLSGGARLDFARDNGIDGKHTELTVSKARSGSVRGSNSYFASKLAAGEAVSGGRFYNAFYPLAIISLFGGGNFPEGVGFAAFRFNIGNGLQYGWVRIKTINPFTNTLVVEDAAWGDPGDKILAGQTSLGALPEQAAAFSPARALGLLAFGSQGVTAWRAQRTQAPD